jgi:hypothetical protein
MAGIGPNAAVSVAKAPADGITGAGLAIITTGSGVGNGPKAAHVRTSSSLTNEYQRCAATKQEQTSSNVIKRHANHQILPAFPRRACRS